MNQLFSFPRFINYARFQISSRQRQYLLLTAGIFVALLLFDTFAMLEDKNWTPDEWRTFFIIQSLIISLIIMGSSFPALRKKDSTISMIMIPTSTLEKFIYELIERIIAFLLLYLTLFYCAANLSYSLAEIINPNGKFIPFSYNLLIGHFKDTEIMTSLTVYFLGVSLIFAGCSAIRKHPLIKTIVYVGAFLLTCFGYMYLTMGKMNLDNGVGYAFDQMIQTKNKDEILLGWLQVFLGISSILALVYAFFKLKEKEV